MSNVRDPFDESSNEWSVVRVIWRVMMMLCGYFSRSWILFTGGIVACFQTWSSMSWRGGGSGISCVIWTSGCIAY